jgi:hypothetical protein
MCKPRDYDAELMRRALTCWQAFSLLRSAMITRHERRLGANAALPSFRAAPTLADQLAASLAAQNQTIQAHNRLSAQQARHDM